MNRHFGTELVTDSGTPSNPLFIWLWNLLVPIHITFNKKIFGIRKLLRHNYCNVYQIYAFIETYGTNGTWALILTFFHHIQAATK